LLFRSTRHTSLLRPDDSMMLVVDMQEPFLRNVWEREHLVRNVGILTEAAKLLRIPLLPTLQNSGRMGGLIPEIANGLPTECVPFDKMCFSCLADDAILSEVQRSSRKQIIVAGVETHICVSQTAHDLLALGYQVHVIADAVSSRRQSDWEIGLSRMERAGAIVSSTETAIYELLGEAGTPEFRAVLALIK
jgi:nicotinamidase-related amidase